MRKKTVKGLVMEKTGRNIIILSRDGEFLKVPAGERHYSPGMEVEVRIPSKRQLPFMLSAAGIAAALFIAVALYLMQPALLAPEAHLSLDINPGVLIALDKNALVIEVEPANEDGEKILEELDVEGADLFEALDVLLEAAHTNNYLSAGRDNTVIISLAAPDSFRIGEDELRSSISNKLLMLEVDTYLKVTVTGLDKFQAAERKDVPLNALVLEEGMREERKGENGLPDNGLENSLPQDSPPKPVREFLQTVDPADIFAEDEFVAGEGRRDEKKPQPPSPPVDIPGIPNEEKGAQEEGAGREHGPAGDIERDNSVEVPALDPQDEQEIPVDLNGESPAP